MNRIFFQALSAVALLLAANAQADVTLLNVSYDPTRELYQEYNTTFARYWAAQGVKRSPSINPTAAPASRRVPSSTVSKPMS